MQFAFVPKNTTIENKTTPPNSSQIPKSNIRIAIYDEPNLSWPSYVSTGMMTNNHTLIESILTSAGYFVTLLNVVDISNHELNTANYDVFIINDNAPRDNITNFVKEYWLGGGSILSFDSAISYMCYFGILPPDSAGNEGVGTYWNYIYSDNQSISTRHPVTKSYQVSDIIGVDYLDWASFDWSALQGTTVASQLYKLANIEGDANRATIVGFDPEDQGGKALHILSSTGFGGDQLLIDAIEWLCPRPKGRILFDLSHFPYYGIDLWDSTYANYVPRYEILRDNLVSRSYTLDKLYPSASGNLTSSNLAPYDVMFLALNNINYTAAEITAVTNWVNNGGSLLITGENIGINEYNHRVNDLLVHFDLRMNTSASGVGSAVYTVAHPTIESCSQISISAPGKIVYGGDAFPIFGADADNIYVAGQEYGNGRIILVSDLAPFRDSTILNADNLRFGINLFNWLCSWDASILIFTDDIFSVNYYSTPQAMALNQLELPFYLTSTGEYLNLSLNSKEWELVIVEEAMYSIDTYYDELVEYIATGGYYIMSTYNIDSTSSHPLWSRLGVAYASDIFTGDPVYMWNQNHDIFTTPIDFSSTQFTSTDSYIDDGDKLTVYSNATALAGFTSLETADNALIVLRNDYHTLLNGYLIVEFDTDYDDSTYNDNIELWINEIAYMWAKSSPPATSSEIPGYDIFIALGSILISISLISLVIVRKRKQLVS